MCCDINWHDDTPPDFFKETHYPPQNLPISASFVIFQTFIQLNFADARQEIRISAEKNFFGITEIMHTFAVDKRNMLEQR